MFSAMHTHLLICYNRSAARIGIDSIVRCTNMLMQFRLGEESLAAADAGMRLLAGVYAPTYAMEEELGSILFIISITSLTSCGKLMCASVEILYRKLCRSVGSCREYGRDLPVETCVETRHRNQHRQMDSMNHESCKKTKIIQIK